MSPLSAFSNAAYTGPAFGTKTPAARTTAPAAKSSITPVMVFKGLYGTTIGKHLDVNG